MKISSVSVWGDSIGKCVVFDEARGRYAICKDNYASHLKMESSAEVQPYSGR